MWSEKYEKFCQSYVLYRNASESAEKAGYSARSAHVTGCRLLKRDDVQARIKDLESELVTEVDVVKEIELAHEYAKKRGNTHSQLKALEMLSKVRGTHKPKVEYTPEELEKDLVNSISILGKEKMDQLMGLAFNKKDLMK